MSDKDDVIVAAYLPISSDTMVVGTGGSAMSVDFGEINKRFAKCSREFFLCRESSEDVRSLLPSIGVDAEVISQEELRQIVREIILEA